MNTAPQSRTMPGGLDLTRLARLAIGLLCLSILPACASSRVGGGGSSDGGDADEDGLTGNFEQLIGTDPDQEDSDGDGYSDAAEYLAYFDPMDEDDHPWERGYLRGPVPTDLDDEGWDEGDLSDDWTAEDIAGDEVDLHDFYGQVIVVDVGAEWCGPCVIGAAVVQEEYEDLKDEGFIVANFVMDGITQGSEPDGDRWANERADGIILDFAVFEDEGQEITSHYLMKGYIPALSVIDRYMNIVGVDVGNYAQLVEEAMEEEIPYVEWPLPENTVELREDLGIEIPSDFDVHLEANIELGSSGGEES